MFFHQIWAITGTASPSAALYVRVYVAGKIRESKNLNSHFVRSGNVNISIGKLWVSGIDGCDWSSWTSSNGIYAHSLVFNTGNVYPSNSDYRWYGFPLRCLVR